MTLMAEIVLAKLRKKEWESDYPMTRGSDLCEKNASFTKDRTMERCFDFAPWNINDWWR